MINVTEPKFFGEVEKLIESRPTADWKTYLRWHLVNDRARYLSKAFVTADFDFYSKYPVSYTHLAMMSNFSRLVST